MATKNNNYNTGKRRLRSELEAMIGAKRGEDEYCSLKDVHLAHYFSRAGVLRHLVQMGLVRDSYW